MRPPPSYLSNHEAVVKAFGYWPSFHDAPVVGFSPDRVPPGAVELALHGWEMTGEVATEAVTHPGRSATVTPRIGRVVPAGFRAKGATTRQPRAERSVALGDQCPRGHPALIRAKVERIDRKDAAAE